MRKLTKYLWLFFLPSLSFGQELAYTTVSIDGAQDKEELSVALSFELTGGKEELNIPLRVIGKNVNKISAIEAEIAGEKYPLSLQLSDNQLVGNSQISIPQSGEKLNLLIRYQLSTDGPKITVPILHPDISALEAKSETFEAKIILSPDQVLRSQFPAMKWKKEANTSNTEYSFELQVLPAWIKFRLYDEDLPFWHLERLVDLGVLLVLMVLGFFGWNYLAKKQTS